MDQRRLPGGFSTFTETEVVGDEVRRTIGVERITGSDKRIDVNLTVDLRRGCLSWVWMTAVGAVFVVLSLPVGTDRLASREGWGWVAGMARASAAVNAALPSFPALVTSLLWVTGAFVLAVLVLGARHRDPRLAWLGVLALVVAAGSVHAIAWGVWAVHATTTAVSRWGGWGWVVVLAVVLVVMARTARKVNAELWVVAVLVNLVYVAVALFVPVALWWSGFPLLRVLVALALLEALGRLLTDQFLGTVKAGRGPRGVLMGSIGVGTSWSVLMLIGDVWDSHDLYPQAVREWVDAWLVANNPPQFDAVVALLVITLATVATAANIRRLRAEPTPEQFARSVLFTLCSMLFAGLVAAIGHRTEPKSDTTGGQ